jgi:hypothetical protein
MLYDCGEFGITTDPKVPLGEPQRAYPFANLAHDAR